MRNNDIAVEIIIVYEEIYQYETVKMKCAILQELIIHWRLIQKDNYLKGVLDEYEQL